MKIEDLLDMELLAEMLEKKYVRFGTHKEFPELRIFEYTADAMFGRVWNDVTMKCRGLIVNWATGEVLARPFDKFFNYGEPSQLEQVRLEMNDEVEVYDKMDGSLGILYRRPDGLLAIATKGSFHSEQADWATKEIRKYMTTHFREDEMTWLFEIIYKDNRIVVTYDFEGLVLLGARDIDFGDTYAPDELLDWKGRKATHFRYKTLREALEATPRPNAEGFVVYLPEFDVRVKIKQEDYLELHRAVFSFNRKRVYDLMTLGKSLEEIVKPLPDEFRKEAEEYYNGFGEEFFKLRIQVLKQYQSVYEEGMTREEFAAKAVGMPHFDFMFSMFDKEDNYLEKVWHYLDPDVEKRRAKREDKPRKKKLSTRQRREAALRNAQ